MKTTLLTLAICSLFLLSPAMASPAGPLDEDAVRARIAASPSLKKAGDADAIVLFEGDYIDYEEGKAVRRHQELIRIYSEWAIDHLGDPRVAWDSSRQELTLNANRTYRVDGGAQNAPANAHNEVTPGGLDRAVDFLDLREMVVTRVGLERGVTVWLDYTIRDFAPGWLPFGKYFFFQGEFPVAERELFVKGLTGATVNPALATVKHPEPVASGGGLLWRAKDLPPQPRDLGPRRGDQLSWAAVFETGEWKTLGSAFASACVASISESGDLGFELEALEKEHHPMGIEDRLDMWMDWIDSRVARIRHGLLPWARPPRTVAEILDTSTATDFERTALLAACCRVKDLPIEIYFPARWRCMMNGPGIPEGLESPGVFIKSRKGKPVHVDSGSWRVDPRPEPGLMVSMGETPTVRWKKIWKVDDRIRMNAFWNLDTGEAKAEVSLFGPAAQDLGLEHPHDLFSDWATSWGDSAEASNISIWNLTPVILQGSLDIRADMPEADDDGYVILEPPFPPLAPSDFRPGGLEHANRDAAWLPGNLLSYDCEWEFILPEGWDAKLPEPRDAAFANGAFSISAEQEDEHIKIHYQLDWNEGTISTNDWPAFHAAMLDALDPEATRIILRESAE